MLFHDTPPWRVGANRQHLEARSGQARMAFIDPLDQLVADPVLLRNHRVVGIRRLDCDRLQDRGVAMMG